MKALLCWQHGLPDTLAYDEMGVFPEASVNLPTQLWVAARLVQAVSFLIAPLFLGRTARSPIALASYAAACFFGAKRW